MSDTVRPRFTLRQMQERLLRMDARMEAKVEADLAGRYRQAFVEIDKALQELYAKMGDPPSPVEARRYGRLAKLQAAIGEQYTRLTGRVISVVRSRLAQSFADSAYGSRWAYEQALGIEIKWPVLSAEAVRSAVWSSKSGEDFADRFKGWRRKDYLAANSAVTSSLAQGLAYAKTAKRLKDTINRSYSDAVRIVRTESTRAYTQGHLETYSQLEEVGVKARKQWVATLDTRTRDSHGALDGEYADEDGMFHSNGAEAEGPGLFNDPAEDINCRCRVIEVVEGYDPEYRRVRGEGIVKYTTFAEWAGKRGWTEEDGWPTGARKAVASEQSKER